MRLNAKETTTSQEVLNLSVTVSVFTETENLKTLFFFLTLALVFYLFGSLVEVFSCMVFGFYLFGRPVSV